ncbi:MAG: hypothetical protein ACOX48_11830 [Limnochordia bacterium]|jgi:stage III sporulation protein AB|nr:MAG: hypothetical protein AA931_01775 [Peptococcaceae bacterium 1109]
MQFIGAALIMLACGMMGLTVARSYVSQAENIKQLITMLQLLETEIGYARTALPEACRRISAQLPGAVDSFLTAVLEHIHAHPGEAFGDGWHAGLGRLGAWGLPAVVLNDLTVLGEALGVSDVEDQRRHLQVTRLRLEDAYRQAEQEWRTNWKLWSYLGFAAGLLILLLIF